MCYHLPMVTSTSDSDLPVPPPSPGDPKIVHGFNLTEIARGTGLTLGHVSRVFNPDPARCRTPSLHTASKIAGYIGVTVDELYSMLTRMRG